MTDHSFLSAEEGGGGLKMSAFDTQNQVGSLTVKNCPNQIIGKNLLQLFLSESVNSGLDGLARVQILEVVIWSGEKFWLDVLSSPRLKHKLKICPPV